jgi:hypothetical protein
MPSPPLGSAARTNDVLPGVVRKVTVARWWCRSRWARWVSGMVWPLAMKGNIQMWRS